MSSHRVLSTMVSNPAMYHSSVASIPMRSVHVKAEVGGVLASMGIVAASGSGPLLLAASAGPPPASPPAPSLPPAASRPCAGVGGVGATPAAGPSTGGAVAAASLPSAAGGVVAGGDVAPGGVAPSGGEAPFPGAPAGPESGAVVAGLAGPHAGATARASAIDAQAAIFDRISGLLSRFDEIEKPTGR